MAKQFRVKKTQREVNFFRDSKQEMSLGPLEASSLPEDKDIKGNSDLWPVCLKSTSRLLVDSRWKECLLNE